MAKDRGQGDEPTEEDELVFLALGRSRRDRHERLSLRGRSAGRAPVADGRSRHHLSRGRGRSGHRRHPSGHPLHRGRSAARSPGIVITHAHEDHIGAVIDLWPRLGVPVYATPFTAGMLKAKLAEYGGAAQNSDQGGSARRAASRSAHSTSRSSRWRTRSPRAARSRSARPSAGLPHRRLEARRDADHRQAGRRVPG